MDVEGAEELFSSYGGKTPKSKVMHFSISVASRISKLWGIVPHSTDVVGDLKKNVGDIHLPYNMTYQKEFIYFTFRHFCQKLK
jgi:hypothetical protein